MLKYGSMLLRLELAGVVGAMAMPRLPDVAGTFLQIALATGAHGQQWIQDTMALLPEGCVSENEKQQFQQTISQACVVDAASHEQMQQSVWCASPSRRRHRSSCLVRPLSTRVLAVLLSAYAPHRTAAQVARVLLTRRRLTSRPNAPTATFIPHTTAQLGDRVLPCRATKRALHELADTCRRNAKCQRQCERALVPQELWPELKLN